MICKRITYTDYDGNTRTEDFRFNISRAELMELELRTPGTWSNYVTQISNAENVPALLEVFKNLIGLAYGVKSEDGKHFLKSKEITDSFFNSEAYSELFMELFSDPTGTAAAEFIKAIIPQNVDGAPAKK